MMVVNVIYVMVVVLSKVVTGSGMQNFMHFSPILALPCEKFSNRQDDNKRQKGRSPILLSYHVCDNLTLHTAADMKKTIRQK